MAERDLLVWRSSHIVVTGGTGFVGTWLLHALREAGTALIPGLRVTALVRDPASFRARSPEVATWANVVRGDVLDPPALDAADVYVHAAAPTSLAAAGGSAARLHDAIVDGTRNVVSAASRNGAIPFLLTSSGAVYGDGIGIPVSEAAEPTPQSQANPYAAAKRSAEAIAMAASQGGAFVVDVAD